MKLDAAAARRLLVALVALAAIVTQTGQARTRKGDKLLSQGRSAEGAKQWDKALDLYEQALSEDPADPAYQMGMRRARFQAGQFHIDQGQKFRAGGQLAEALAEFEKAYSIDPASSIAEQEIRRTRGMIERERKRALAGEQTTPEERALTPIEQARKETAERVSRIMPMPELKPLSEQPINLKMNNQPPRVLFETVGKLAGVNVLFDPDSGTQGAGRNQSVEFINSTIEEALDHLSLLTRSFWKPLNANTIFVTQDNTTKRRDYEEQVMKIFYLTNVNTPQELQEIATDVRSICDIRRLFTYNAQMAIIVRGEADRVALAEKLIADLDKPKAEVVIDILVMEANRNKSRDLAATLTPNGFNSPITYLGGQAPAAAAPAPGAAAAATPAATDRSTLLSQLKLSTNQYSVTMPNGLLKALLDDRSTRVLQSPQVRAADAFKASLKIGDKVPTASGSFQPGIGGVGINPLVNTQFQFLDVGVNVDITPKIHGLDEVSLHVEVDISNVRDRIDLGGIQQPVIGQRKVTFDVRLREGEANVLGGLVQRQDTKSITGFPLLGQIPVLGRLFSSESITQTESELLFVLIPHIVRAPEITAENLKGVAVGNDQTVKLSYAARRAATAGSRAAARQPAPDAPPATAPALTPTAPPATAPPTTPTVPAAPETRLLFSPAPAEGQVGAAITVSLMVENAKDLFTAPFRIKFDPKVVHLNDVVPGTLLTLDGLKIMPPTKNIQNDTGDATITLARMPGAGGVSGSGMLVTFIFQAVGKGNATIVFPDLTLRNAQLQQIAVKPPEVTITVR